ncbi:N-acetylmuramic acid 6-phosphate etherase [Bradyrhizobium sp. WYCCWR 13023]|uniref:N-acetylmuramic acid 6-phosphate etherase n=1 Tax=Bradyrhizobium zhengyangense TaxID=2911009 RepID=A0A9X1U688_9BRAD|nr:N-acetylmuramic acid 6-phosphate etherase [Bradyrhizobium zhengyangense]MCG2625621.1 N-acetylmuramic acid 6-phosphate etherase [Bradyrhizobium zhengyangense]MCG2638235.1 N-acetylmuramic acid 6-phosphate etherase [Bradyrhizobium zhengyangense]MCG2666634.1 N-acetylmuramic acid 6-phosphate etherase [Bradyrhizobium zhengyangense]
MLVLPSGETVGERCGDTADVVTTDEAMFAEAMLASYRRAIASVAAVSSDIRTAALRLAAVWRAGGRLVYAGAGSSGLAAAEDAAELPGTFGLDQSRIAIVLPGGAVEPFRIDGAAEDDAAAGERSIAELGDLSGDAVIAVSASGSTPFTVAAAAEARRRGAFVIGIAHRPASQLLVGADASILLESGEEALRGSTRLAAGAAQKAALGMLSSLMGLDLGHIHQGLMVNLKADNAKLRERARGIVAAIADVSDAKAAAALREADGDVKPAVLIACGIPSMSEAVNWLAAAEGRIDDALRRARGNGIKGEGPNKGA